MPLKAAGKTNADELQSEYIDLYFNVLRFVAALVREQEPLSPDVTPAKAQPSETLAPMVQDSMKWPDAASEPATFPGDNKSLSGVHTFDNNSAGPHDTPSRVEAPSSICGSGSGTSSGSAITSQQSGARRNRVVLPPELADPLEAFRMAVTNLPRDEANIRATRHTLYEAVIAAFPQDEITTRRIFGEAEGNEHLGGSSSIYNDFGHRFSSTDDMQTMQEVLPGLWCGSYHPATNKATLKRHGITHILSCIGTAARFPGEFMYMSIPLSDSPDFNITPFLHRTFEFIENALIRENSGILVHCGAGISRAPAVTAAYLMRKLRIPSKQAISLVQRNRPYASPNAGFCRQLRTYGRQLQLTEPQEKDGASARQDSLREGKAAALKALALQKKPEPGSVAAKLGKNNGANATAQANGTHE